MSYIMRYEPTDSITAESNFAVYGEARAGSNGDPNGAPEVDAGTASNAVADRRTWDSSDESGGFNTGNVAVALNANLASGSDSWSVAGEADGQLVFSGPSGGTIKEVDLFAGAQLPARVFWRNVQVEFFKGGVLQETIYVGNGPRIDTTTTDTGAGEQEFVVTPTSTDDDQAIITGNIQMVCPDGTYPNPDDLFAQAFVVAN